MASEPVVAALQGHRLHPFSWLFVLLTQLRPVVLPMLVLLFLGRGEWWEWFVVVGAFGYAVYALIYSIGFRYYFGSDELIVKEGIFARSERHIPYARIQNIVRKRNPLHRIFGVAELRLESAGGSEPEAVMNVITMAAVDRLEAVLHEGRHAPAVADAAAPPLLALTTGDLLRLGLTNNRGGVLIGALFAFAWQFEPWEHANIRGSFRIVGALLSKGASLVPGPLAMFFSVLGLAIAFFIAMKLLSIAMVVLDFHGFRLTRDRNRVATESGLLTRRAASARIDKIQRLIYGESWLSRKFGRRRLECDVAAGTQSEDDDKSTRMRWLAPIASVAAIDRVVAELAPQLSLERCDWQPLHARAWRRVLKSHVLVWTAAMAPASIWFGWWVLPLWAGLMVWSWIAARGWARFAAWSLRDGVFAYRSGFVSREWIVVNIHKGQGVGLSSSPFDRRANMENVELDTAGASATGSRLQVPYLDEAVAKDLMKRLREAIDQGPDPLRLTVAETLPDTSAQ